MPDLVVTRVNKILNKDEQYLFDGIIHYKRVDLLTYYCRNLVTDQNWNLPYQYLAALLPSIYAGIIEPNKILGIMHNNEAEFVCDFIAGKIFTVDDDRIYSVDYFKLAADSYEPPESTDTISSNYDKILHKDICELYENKKEDILKYLTDVSPDKDYNNDPYRSDELVKSISDIIRQGNPNENIH